MRRKKRPYQPEYVAREYKKITGKTFLRFAVFSMFIFLILMGYTLYKNYSILIEANHSNIGDEIYLINLMPYSEVFKILLVATGFFVFLSFLAFIHKKRLEKKLPLDYFKETPEEINKKIYTKIHLLYARKKNPLIFLIRGFLASVSVFSILFLIYILGGRNFSYVEIGVGISISLLVGVIVGFLQYIKNSSDLENLQWQTDLKAIRDDVEINDPPTIEQLNQIDTDADRPIKNNDFAATLFQRNLKYLTAYNELTKRQADRSFALALFSCMAGAVLIVIGAILLFFDKTNPTYLATTGGVLAEIISTVFLYFHTNTIKSMGKYHDKLLLSQNIAIAAKIADELPLESRNSAHEKLVEQLVSDINKCISFENK